MKAVARHVFSTKTFGAGHVLGAAFIALGTLELAKRFLGWHEDETRARVQTEFASARPMVPIGNDRGQYGVRTLP